MMRCPLSFLPSFRKVSNQTNNLILLLGGNPAAVCLLEEDITDDLKQKIAMEMNISETAFVVPLEKDVKNPFENGAKFELRWFTPTTEVPLCGHATLASAATLFYTQGNKNVSRSQARSEYNPNIWNCHMSGVQRAF